MKKVKKFYITKTRYVESYFCDKKLHKSKYMPHLKAEPTLSERLNMEQGVKVGDLATTMYEGGVLVNNRDKEEAARQTAELIKNGCPYIFEATFIWNDLALCQVDILKNNFDGTFDIIEVKSSNSVKKYHYIDVAFQKWVLESCGYDVKDTYLMHLNRDYVRKGELNLNALFLPELVNDGILEYYDEVENKLGLYGKVLDSKVEPKCKVGSQCKTPHKCPWFDLCNKENNKDSVSKLSRLSKAKKQVLDSEGVKYIKDIDGEVSLTPRQMTQHIASTRKTVLIDKEKVKDFLSEITYPIHHLDFEATNNAIPKYDGASPNKFIVYQYSIDTEKENGEIHHHEYLHLEHSNPSRKIAEDLIRILGTEGTITVWHKTFEAGRIKEFMAMFPELSDKLQAIIDRMIDLEVPFKKTWVYHHDLQGSSSIKYVLPFLCPDLDYSRLVISNGNDSQAMYNLLMDGKKEEEREDVIEALLAYNNLDTYAMLRVLKSIKELVEKKDVSDNEFVVHKKKEDSVYYTEIAR